MHNFKELVIWQKSIELCTDIYKVVSLFSRDELYGLNTQIKRSAVSIAANISEGAGRNSDKEFVHFLSLAQGSGFELQTHLIIANNVGLIGAGATEEILFKLDEIQKMNRSLQKKLTNGTKES